MNNMFKKVLVGTMISSLSLSYVAPFSVMAADESTTSLTSTYANVSDIEIDGNIIYANGNDLILEEGTNGTLIYVNGELLTDTLIGEDSNGLDGYDLSQYVIFGGGKDLVFDEDTKIVVNGGNVKTIYAGGNSVISKDVVDNTQLVVDEITNLLNDLYATVAEDSEITEDMLADLKVSLDETLASLEEKLTATDASVEEILEELEIFVDNFNDVILPYVTEESTEYVNEVVEALLTDLTDSVTTYVEELENTINEKVDTVIQNSILDILKIVFGLDDITEEKAEEYINAIIAIQNNNVEGALEDYEEAQEILEAHNATEPTMPEDKPVAPVAPASSLSEAVMNARDSITSADIVEIINSCNESVVFADLDVNRLDIDSILSVIQDENIAYTDINDYVSDYYDYTGLSTETTGFFGLIPSEKTQAQTAYAAFIVALQSDITTDSLAAMSSYDTSVEEYEASYAIYKEELADWEPLYDEYLLELKEFNELQEIYEANETAAKTELETEVSNLVTNLNTVSELVNLGDDFGTNCLNLMTSLISGDTDSMFDSFDAIIDSFTITSPTLSFIIESYMLVIDSGFSTDLTFESTEDLEGVTTLLEGIIDLADEYDIDQEIEKALNAVVENIEEEFNLEFVMDELENLSTAIEDGFTNFESNLGEVGYPALPEDKIEEILETVKENISDLGTEEEINDIIEQLQEKINDDSINNIIKEVIDTANQYMADTDASISETLEYISGEIIDIVNEELSDLIDSIINDTSVTIESSDVVINDGYVETLYANGDELANDIDSVNVTINGGYVGNISTTLDTVNLVINGGSVENVGDLVPVNSNGEAVYSAVITGNTIESLTYNVGIDGLTTIYAWLADGSYYFIIDSECVKYNVVEGVITTEVILPVQYLSETAVDDEVKFIITEDIISEKLLAAIDEHFTLQIDSDEASNAIVRLDNSALTSILDSKSTGLNINTDNVQFNISTEALTSIVSQSNNENVYFIKTKIDNTSINEELELTESVVYELKVVTESGKVITNFDGEEIIVTLAYELSADENIEDLFVYYINDNNELIDMNATYSNENSYFEFTTNHFSNFAIININNYEEDTEEDEQSTVLPDTDDEDVTDDTDVNVETDTEVNTEDTTDENTSTSNNSSSSNTTSTYYYAYNTTTEDEEDEEDTEEVTDEEEVVEDEIILSEDALQDVDSDVETTDEVEEDGISILDFWWILVLIIIIIIIIVVYKKKQDEEE